MALNFELTTHILYAHPGVLHPGSLLEAPAALRACAGTSQVRRTSPAARARTQRHRLAYCQAHYQSLVIKKATELGYTK